MYLTKEEEKILDGEYGEVLRRCMNLLVSLGDIYGAEKLIPIKSAQIPGVSYKTIGDIGLEFLEDFAKENVKVKSKLFFGILVYGMMLALVVHFYTNVQLPMMDFTQMK